MGVGVYPFVPTWAPAVVVNVNLVFSNVDDLRLQPLLNCIFGIDPHSDFKLALAQIKLFQIGVVFWIFSLILSSLSFSKSPIADICHMIFLFDCIFVLYL